MATVGNRGYDSAMTDSGGKQVDVASSGGAAHDHEISLAAVAATLLRGRLTVVLLVVLGGVIGGANAQLPAAKYRATASFMPQQSPTSNFGGLTDLVGQLGMSIPASGGAESPDFYLELLSSREILTPVLLAEYTLGDAETGGSHATLLELSRIGGRTQAQAIDQALYWLSEAVSSSVSRQTGVITVSVITGWPEVSYQVADLLLKGINEFNSETRQSQAQAERIFLQSRVDGAREDLFEAEGGLQEFLQQNRQFVSSPSLQFRYDRLQRQLSMRQQVYTGLLEAYEQARIQEVRNTPVITVIENPILPAGREARRTVRKTLLGLILGGIAGTFFVLIRAGASNRSDAGTAALAQAWAEAKDDLRRLIPDRHTS